MTNVRARMECRRQRRWGERLDGTAVSTKLLPTQLNVNDKTAGSVFERSVTDRLRILSDLHIFQWATYYRYELQQVIKDALRLLQDTNDRASPFEMIGRLFRSHSTEIFTKGFRHVSSLAWASNDLSRSKSLGARASANLFSLVSSARANGLEPYAYLNHVFENLPAADTVEALEALLPWNVKPVLRVHSAAAA